MTTGETLQSEQDLIARIQSELEFVPDESGEWLVNDDFEQVTGVNADEWLPCRVRLSAAGDRLEFGARKVDLQKTLELARIKGKDSYDLDAIRHFWPDDCRITATEDESWLFFGAPIEPTLLGFESQFHPVKDGLDVALQASIDGKTYAAIKANDEEDWLIHWLKAAENGPEHGARTIIFKEETAETAEEAEIDSTAEEDDADQENIHDSWDRKADNLKQIRLNKFRLLTEATAIVAYGGIGVENVQSNLRSSNSYADGKQHVYLSGSWIKRTEDKHNFMRHDYDVELVAPDDVELRTIEDLSQVTVAKVKIREENEPQGEYITVMEQEAAVNVLVDDHSISVIYNPLGSDEELTIDKVFSVHFFEPACTDCKTPIWKFPPLPKELLDRDPRTEEVVMWTGMGRGNGVYEFTLGKGEMHDERDIYCYDCYENVKEEFAQEYPAARRANAVAAVRAKLDEIGYNDVQIMAEQIWPNTSIGDGDLEVFTYIEYERNGRKIMRKVGRPKLNYDGTVFPNMPPREYVDFR